MFKLNLPQSDIFWIEFGLNYKIVENLNSTDERLLLFFTIRKIVGFMGIKYN